MSWGGDRQGGRENKKSSLRHNKRLMHDLQSKKDPIPPALPKSLAPPPLCGDLSDESALFIDSWVGLLSRQFERDRETVLRRATNAGVRAVVVREPRDGLLCALLMPFLHVHARAYIRTYLPTYVIFRMARQKMMVWPWDSRQAFTPDVQKQHDMIKMAAMTAGQVFCCVGVHTDNVKRTNEKVAQVMPILRCFILKHLRRFDVLVRPSTTGLEWWDSRAGVRPRVCRPLHWPRLWVLKNHAFAVKSRRMHVQTVACLLHSWPCCVCVCVFVVCVCVSDSREASTHFMQDRLFETHIRVAAEIDLPAIIHIVDSVDRFAKHAIWFS